MKRYAGASALVLAVSVTAAATLMRESPAVAVEAPQTLRVAVHRLVPVDVRDRVVGHGRVEPRWTAALASEVDGRIVAIAPGFQPGAIVEQGVVLVTLDATRRATTLAGAEAQLASARRVLSEERQRIRMALDGWRASGRVEPPSALLLREPQLAEAKARVGAAEAEVVAARHALEATRIRMPFDGVITARQVGPGDYVGPGSALGAAYDHGVFEVAVPLALTELARLPAPLVGHAVSLAAARDAGERWEGRVVRVGHDVHRTTGTRIVVVELVRAPKLMPGLFVTATFEGRLHRGVLPVPEHLRDPDGAVWFVDGAQQLRRFDADALFTRDGTVFIRAPEAANGAAGTIDVAAHQPVFLPGVRVASRLDVDPPRGSTTGTIALGER